MPNSADPKECLGIRVLLVDDNQIFLNAATCFLQRHPNLIVVGAVLGGEEALAMAQELQPRVILLDLDMPGLGGLETIPRLRAILPKVVIVALTLLSGSAYRRAALAAGADDFVSKANLDTDLLPAIRRTVQADWPGDKPERKSNAGPSPVTGW